MIREARRDPIFYIENYLRTFDPRPEAYPHDLDFILYDFQKEYIRGLLKAIQEGHDLFDEKSRDMGISWLSLALRLWFWRFGDGYQCLVGSRKEDYVDDGTVSSLFGKLDYLIQHMRDPKGLPPGFDRANHRTYMKLVNPANGNTITGESSNKNFSRGGRYTDVFFDEFGFWPDAQGSWSAAGDATRCRHGVTTPPDEPSFSRTLRFSDKIRVRTWHWQMHPHKDLLWYAREKARRTAEEVLHELDISWEYSNIGRPYPEVGSCRVGHYPYTPKAPLYISLDVGLDAVAVGWYQSVPNTDWIVIIEAFESHEHIIDWYLPFFGKALDSRFNYSDTEFALIEQVRLWQPGIFFGDPSGKQRHVESNVSPYAILHEHGIYVQTNDAENNWTARRDALKRLFSHFMVNETPGTKWWLQCIQNAHYPKREETSQAVNPIAKPVHDWSSHHRTQSEFFAVNFKTDFDPNPSRIITPRRPDALFQETPHYGIGTSETYGTVLDLERVMRQTTVRADEWRYR